MSEKQPLLTHLDELLKRVRWIFLGLLGASGLGYALSRQIIEFFQIPLKLYMPQGFKLVYTQPLEKFWVVVRVSLVAGMALALPFIVYQIYGFLRPAFKSGEKASFIRLILGAMLSFSIGVYLGYQYVLPALVQVIIKFASLDVLPFLTLSSYVNSVLGLLLLCGLLCEIPVVMIFLSARGWVASSFWIEQRKPAIIINAVLSALLSPPDPVSMLVMMIPLHLLFEAGILGSRMAEYFSVNEKQKLLHSS